MEFWWGCQFRKTLKGLKIALKSEFFVSRKRKKLFCKNRSLYHIGPLELSGLNSYTGSDFS